MANAFGEDTKGNGRDPRVPLSLLAPNRWRTRSRRRCILVMLLDEHGDPGEGGLRWFWKQI